MSGTGFEELSRAHERTKADLARATRKLRELVGIGVRLAAEREADAVLDLILAGAPEITWSDAGSLYLVDTDGAGVRWLRSALVQNDSLPVAFKEHVIAIGPQSAGAMRRSTARSSTSPMPASRPPGRRSRSIARPTRRWDTRRGPCRSCRCGRRRARCWGCCSS